MVTKGQTATKGHKRPVVGLKELVCDLNFWSKLGLDRMNMRLERLEKALRRPIFSFRTMIQGVGYAEENTLFFMQGPRGGPRSFYFDVTNVF